MSTLFWTYLNRTIYLMVYEFIGNNKIAFLALSRVKWTRCTRPWQSQRQSYHI